jgi:hypothetical protein
MAQAQGLGQVLRYVDELRDFIIELYRGFIPIKALAPEMVVMGSGIGLITCLGW